MNANTFPQEESIYLFGYSFVTDYRLTLEYIENRPEKMHIQIQKLLKKILIYTALLIGLAIVATGILFILVYTGSYGQLPAKNEMSAIKNEQASLVISSDSILIGEYFAQNRTNIKWEELPVHLKNALIATEDKRFFTHKGYDTRSYLRVFLRSIMLRDNSGGGGSTLTQQLVKNLYGRKSYGLLSMPVNKIREIIIATRLENVYTKEELLLLYFNSVPFGEDVFGVEAAAQRYFNKHTRELNIQESAVLVALLKANTFFNPRLNPANSLSRRNLVLNQMEKENYITAKEADSLKKTPLHLNYENVSQEAPAGYFVYQVKKQTLDLLDAVKQKTGKDYNLEKDGLKIYTTLNMRVQEMATAAVKKQLSAMQPLFNKEIESHNVKKQWLARQKQMNQPEYKVKKDIELFDWNGMQTKTISKSDSIWYYYKMLNAAVLITNPRNGTVLAWIGGNNFNMLPFDMVLSHRQIASAFKPFLYATAFENGFAPCDYLGNNQNTYPGYEDWEPENYNHSSTPDSTIALWYALANSMNLPTVDLYFKVGREKLLYTCNRLKFPGIAEDAPSIALGSLDLSLYEVVRAYSAFANKGKMNEMVLISKITDADGNILYKAKQAESRQVFTSETADMITAILQQAINQGTGTKIRSTYGIRAQLAGKTGTAQNYSNAWFIAYTPDMVLGTWVGARTPDIHFFSGNGSGATLALPIVANVIKSIENDKTLRKRYLTSFATPGNVSSLMQCDPFRQIGIKGFFKRLFNGKSAKSSDNQDADKKKKNK